MRRIRAALAGFVVLALCAFGAGQGSMVAHLVHVHHGVGDAFGLEIDLAPSRAAHGPQCRNAQAHGDRAWDIPDPGATRGEQACVMARLSRERTVALTAAPRCADFARPARRDPPPAAGPPFQSLALYHLAPKHSPPSA